MSIGFAEAKTAEGLLLVPPAATRSARRLFALDDASSRLHLLDTVSGTLFSATLDNLDFRSVGTLAEAIGARALTTDSMGRTLYLLDSSGSRVLGVDLQESGPLSPTIVADLDQLDMARADLLASNPVDGYLYLLSWQHGRLDTLATTGVRKGSYAIALEPPNGAHMMTFAPSQDLTDPAGTYSLFILGETEVHELWLQEVPQKLSAVGTLVKTTDTSTFSPPSPDPVGLTYWSTSDLLVFSDSEVDELELFENKNIFVVTRDGNLSGYSSVIEITSEPRGVAYNPLNGRFFYVDPNPRRIYDVNRAPNNDATIADLVIQIKTNLFGSNDPQGIAFDPSYPRLFVVDGVNREVYEIHPDGAGTFSDATITVTSFDVEVLGMVSPEGIEFDPDSGHLFILDSYVSPEGTSLIYETTTNGLLIQTIDISAAAPIKPAGITLAPSSDDSTQKSVYIVDRGVDPGDPPTENDGRLYELRMFLVEPTPTPSDTPTSTPSATPTSTPSATPTGTPIQPGPTATKLPQSAGFLYLPMVSALLHDTHGEPNDTCEQSYTLSINEARTFRPEDRDDWYRFTTWAQGTVSVNLNAFLPEKGQVAVYRGGSCSDALFLKNVGTSATTKTVDLGIQPANTFFVYVSNDGTLMTEPYWLEMQFQPSSP